MYEKYEKLLEENGITTYQVSKATGISQAALSAWKKRGGSMSFSNMKKIADFFNVDTEYFYGQTEGKKVDLFSGTGTIMAQISNMRDFAGKFGLTDEDIAFIETYMREMPEDRQRFRNVMRAMMGKDA